MKQTKKEILEEIFKEIKKLKTINIVYTVTGCITHLIDYNDIHILKKELLK